MGAFIAGHNEDAASILRQFDVAASSGQQISEQEQASSALDSAQSHHRESLATASAMSFAPTPAGGSWASASQRFHPQVITPVFFGNHQSLTSHSQQRHSYIH